MIVFKVVHRLLIEGYSLLICLFYRSCVGVFFENLPWTVKFYGFLRFGTVGNKNIIVGNNCYFGNGVYVSVNKSAKLVVGEGSGFNTGCHIVAVYGIEIGNNTAVGEYVSIRDQNHNFDNIDIPINQQGFLGKPIKIGNDVWIGRGVYIGPGVEIGDGAIVGANSVVIKSIPPYTIVGGVPAREIRKR